MRADPRRLDEFARYHVDGDGECNGVVINGIADGRVMGLLERIELSYFYSVVYNVPSALFMYEQKDAIRDDPWGWAEKNRRKVMFTSDRHWVNISDRFERLLEQFGRATEEFTATIGKKGAIDVAGSVDSVMGWYYFSRFCAYLFVETAARATGLQTENMPVFDVLHGDTATSGLMNIAGMDDEANEFDATSKVPTTCSVEALLEVMDSATREIENRGGSADVTEVETSLCAYRKFHKGSRYNGFYLDRMLGELMKYPLVNDGSVDIVNEIFEVRAKAFDHRFLGEFGGWKGVRNGMKTHYMRTGEVNW